MAVLSALWLAVQLGLLWVPVWVAQLAMRRQDQTR
jgi:hypothetical protein